MRLSTDRDRDESRALEVLYAAFDAGITFLDTADAYCWDATEAGHNERLIARGVALPQTSGTRRDSSSGKARPDRIRPDGAVPLSARAGAAGSVRRVLTR